MLRRVAVVAVIASALATIVGLLLDWAILPLESEEDFITWTENVDRDIQLTNEFYVAVLTEEQQQRNVAPEAEEERLRKLEQARTWTA